MRILHTADWHAGRVWRGRRRLDELSAVLDDLADRVRDEGVDLVLVAGDVFDQRHPPAWAVDRVLACLRRLGDSGARTVMVSGNHDSRERLAAWGRIADLVGVSIFVTPGPASVVEVETKAGQTAVVAAAPFAPMRSLVGALELSRDEEAARATWAEALRALLARQARSFRIDTVNLLVGHLAIDGARVGGSESRPLRGGEWTLAASDLPATADYVALGHIHRRQRLPGKVEAWYAGSPLQLDFSEVDQEKGALLVEVDPGERARVREIPLDGGRPLLDVGPYDLAELEQRAGDLAGAGWLRVRVRSEAPDPDLASRVRRLLPEAVVVRLETRAESAAEEPAPLERGRAARELYADYHRATYGDEPTRDLLEAFERWEREASDG